MAATSQSFVVVEVDESYFLHTDGLYRGSIVLFDRMHVRWCVYGAGDGANQRETPRLFSVSVDIYLQLSK